MTTVVQPNHTLTARGLDGSGDSEFTWDLSNHAEVTMARELFDRMRAKGYAIYRTPLGASDRDAETMPAFDANAGHMAFVAPLQGG